MFNSKRKRLLDKELELYKQEKILAIDVEINNRKQGNWEALDKVRFASHIQISDINVQVAKLEAKKEALTGEMELLKNENTFLRNTISQFAKNQAVFNQR